ncbi:cyclin-T [Drosophila sulfurigaster albostrigata]|uniref:cyclin-T n=1 Tax=Drosophila sulfurigaster albostrigata TaxID=89887 RepID=UPI002D21DD0A|nr:cyclin-T [Drosophila sulfurigaster albostrigata]
MSLLGTPAGGVPVSSSSIASSSSSSSTSLAVNAGSSSNNNSNATPSGSNSNNNLPFEKDKIWYFSNEQLGNSPSRRCGIKCDDELHYRQMTAYLIQEMGQRLQVSQLCINTAIVYMHRFYAFHSFTHFHRNSMASASLFLAAKVEEQPRKLEHVIRAANKCLPQTTEQSYADLAQELVFNENVLLQTLGFDVAIDHPHTHVVRTCQLVKACKDLAQTSYFLASNSLHLTSMCLQYRPTVVACFCIYLACKWSRWEIPQSTEGKHWFYYVDKSVSLELLKQLTDEFIAIYEKSPARLKSKLNSIKAIAQGASNRTATNSKDNKPKEDWKMSEMMKGYHSNITAPPELMNGSGDSRDPPSQVPLLPPPAMVPPQQRQRSDGSHQRSSSAGAPGNSSSTTSSSSNHKLPNYPGSLPPEAHGDHKSKQPGYGSRAPSSHPSSSSSSQRSSSGNSSSASSSQRSSSSSQASGRPPMGMDYHKSSRGMPPGVGMPPHGAHKMSTSSKPPPMPLLDGRSSNSSATNSSSSSASTSSSGVSSKDLSKSSSGSSSSNKMYPNAPPPYNNSGPPNPLMSRGGYQGSSSNSSGVGVNNGAPLPNAGYGSHSSSHRNKSVASSSSSSSVHSMPPYEQQLPYGQGQGVPSYNHMQQQQQQQLPTLEAPPPTMTTQPQQQQQQPQQLSKNSSNSLFSPEPHFNGLLPPPPPGPAHESLGYKLNNHTRDRDSPKKERLTPTKKDKHRSTLPHGSSSSSSGSSSTAKAMLPPHKKPHGDLVANELAGPSRDGSSSLKRANEISGSQYGLNKLDEHDGSLPRDKVRKLENSVGLPGYGSYGSEDKHAPLSISNGGIETTPDLVRSLLKESLCTPNASLLKPDALTMPGLKPPAELLEPMPTAAPVHIKKEPIGGAGGAAPTSLLGMEQLDALTKLGESKDLDGSGKSEKKKKKDKHKHKEKDKSKDKPDKEERKKHKKDKQKERSSKDTSMDSLKLVITTNTATANPNGSLQAAAPLKLKISKNKVEPNNYSAAGGATGLGGGMPHAAMPTAPTTGFGMPPTLSAAAPMGMPGQQQQQQALVIPTYGGYNSTSNSTSSGSSSSKKKHSDRDRDKESSGGSSSSSSSKKSKSQDYAKYNGGVSGVGIGGGGVGVGAVYAPLGGGAGAASLAQSASQVSSLLGLPMTMPNSMVMTPADLAAGIPPSALPIYNKK